ncbi:MAG: hypothetical protein LWX54_01665 [Deltaproteobacteria bacterium]|nr:hypothetical protein [Deltaproteobacteria bacterium]
MELREPRSFVLAVAMAMVLMVSGGSAFAGQTVSDEAWNNGLCDLAVVFETQQAIATIGAMDWESFEISGETYLAVANYYNDSSYNVDSRIYKWNGTSFVEIQAVATNGAHDWESFEIGGETYLAVANYYNGSTRNINSEIYKWNGTSFVEFQAVPTNGAMDWESFEISGETYLAVANYYNDSSYNVDSRIYKWNGTSFVEIQAVATNGAHDWESFEIDGETYLAVANQYNGSIYNINSRIYKWDGTAFVEFQAIATLGALDWESFEIGGETYLAVANYRNDSTCIINSRIYQAIKCTKVSGMIYNETWTQECSPYFVEGDILAAGLTIEPGVMVKFLGNYVFEVAGVLTATGTGQDPIIFTSADTNKNGWQGIFFHQSTPGSELVYCTIEDSINRGIRFDNTEPTIENCTINNNGASGSGGGIYIDLTTSAGTIVLKDCAITGNNSSGYGGGIRADLGDGTLILDDCMITGNTSSSHGGGISANTETGSLNLTDCEISDNHSNPAHAGGNYVGGGIHAGMGENGALSLSNCRISGNTCYSYNTSWGGSATCRGGGIFCNGNINIANCRIENNSTHARSVGKRTEYAYGYGGGIYHYSGVLTAVNCIVAENSTSASSAEYCYAYGGGIHVYGGTADLENCTVVNNTNHGLRREGGTVTAINSIFFDNSVAQISGTVTATYSCVEDSWEGEGNIFQNPILGSCLQLMPFVSPCIDKGDPDPQYNDVCFPPSLGAVQNDMGAYGGPGACQWETCNGDFDSDLDIDGSDLSVFAANFGRTDCSGYCEGDFDENGDVDRSDLAVFAADFGRTDCPFHE